jgi:hypothetical protein
MTCSPGCDDRGHNGPVITVVAAMAPSGGPGLLIDEAQADQYGPGLVAFTIVVLLGVATFFLIRSMLHHLGKVPPTFDTDEHKDDDAGTDGSASGVDES